MEDEQAILTDLCHFASPLGIRSRVLHCVSWQHTDRFFATHAYVAMPLHYLDPVFPMEGL